MKSLGEILREIAAKRDEGLTDQEIERRVTAYYTAAGVACLTCYDYGKWSVKRYGEVETFTWAHGRQTVKAPEYIYAVSCPECGGKKGTPEDVAMRRCIRAGLPPASGSFDSWDMQLNPPINPHFRQVRAWADRPSGGLVLTGSTGRGKTHLLQATIAHLAVQGVRTAYWRVPDLLGWFQRGINPPEGEMTYAERIEAMKNITVLALDDYGLGSVTETGAGTIEEIVDARYWHGERPWLFATNTGPKEWGARLTSRFTDRTRVSVLAFEGNDVRPMLGVGTTA